MEQIEIDDIKIESVSEDHVHANNLLDTTVYSNTEQEAEENLLPCELCLTTFEKKCDLESHLLQVHPERLPPSLIKHLKARVAAMHAETEHQCPICHERFEQNSYLKTHMESHGRKCPCGERHKLAAHSSAGKKVKTHPCLKEGCEKRYYTAAGLKRHVRRHTELKPQCEYCGKFFATSNNLKRHMDLHTNTRFMCRLCPKKYTQINSVKMHFAIEHPKQEWTGYDITYQNENV